jgi:radical SAM superfamily enzyme YgiQ (UPF0313 family)
MHMPPPKSVLLIHPPVSKPCEPPAGIARLSWALKSRGIDCRIYDANLDGFLHLLEHPAKAADTWTRRAVAGVSGNLSALRSGPLYKNKEKYKRAVNDINRVIHKNCLASGVQISLSNYTSPGLLPVRSSDLLRSAETFLENPFFPAFRQGISNLINQQRPDIVGLSVNFMSQALCAFAIAGFIRKEFPKLRIVMGGGLISSWKKIPCFDNPFSGLADDLIAGPGEHALLAMCGCNRELLPHFSGFDYSDLTLNEYLAPGFVLPYSTSTGCYWRKCKFCPEKSENQGYAPLDPQSVVEDLQTLISKHHPLLIHFLDNALSPRLLTHFINHPSGAPWYGFARVTDHLADGDFVMGLKKSGCMMLKLGIESGDQAVLDSLDKGIEVGVASRALQTLHNAGIATYVYLLFGMPAENEAGARKTLEFTISHADAIDFLNLAVFNLPAHGEEAESLDTNEFYQGDLSLYREFKHPMGWNRDRVRQFLEKEFKQQRPIRKIIQKDPPFFTSNHAPLMVMSQAP